MFPCIVLKINRFILKRKLDRNRRRIPSIRKCLLKYTLTMLQLQKYQMWNKGNRNLMTQFWMLLLLINMRSVIQKTTKRYLFTNLMTQDFWISLQSLRTGLRIWPTQNMTSHLKKQGLKTFQNYLKIGMRNQKRMHLKIILNSTLKRKLCVNFVYRDHFFNIYGRYALDFTHTPFHTIMSV